VVLFALSAVFVWIVIWYFISSLSESVRKRDHQLSIANEQLRRAEEEKTRQVLITTHELKSPFAGIENNIQVLRYQYWDQISPEMQKIIERIEARAQTLRERIRKILMHGDLKSSEPVEDKMASTDIKSVINSVMEELRDKARERNIEVDIQVPNAVVLGDTKNLSIFFSNLISNAIYYSYEGGKVEITGKENTESVYVSVRDHGTGIREDALPKIFDEYFHTNEAAKFNKMSTGLGLSMVKEIARRLGFKISVTSSPGEGTTFNVKLPKGKKRK